MLFICFLYVIYRLCVIYMFFMFFMCYLCVFDRLYRHKCGVAGLRCVAHLFHDIKNWEYAYECLALLLLCDRKQFLISNDLNQVQQFRTPEYSKHVSEYYDFSDCIPDTFESIIEWLSEDVGNYELILTQASDYTNRE